MTSFSLFECDPTKSPKLSVLTLNGIFSSGGSGHETTQFICIFFGLGPVRLLGPRFVRILVLFLRHKGTRGMNDIRSLQRDAKHIIPIKVGG